MKTLAQSLNESFVEKRHIVMNILNTGGRKSYCIPQDFEIKSKKSADTIGYSICETWFDVLKEVNYLKKAASNTIYKNFEFHIFDVDGFEYTEYGKSISSSKFADREKFNFTVLPLPNSINTSSQKDKHKKELVNVESYNDLINGFEKHLEKYETILKKKNPLFKGFVLKLSTSKFNIPIVIEVKYDNDVYEMVNVSGVVGAYATLNTNIAGNKTLLNMQDEIVEYCEKYKLIRQLLFILRKEIGV